MTPETDPTWPRCDVHVDHVWCDHVRGALIRGEDAEVITNGMRYCVPVVPVMGLYAEVSIDIEWIIPDLCANISLVFGTDWTTDTEQLIDIGMWTKGEGRMVMSSVLHAWALGVAEDTCRANTHSLPQESALQQGISEGKPEFLLSNSWCMAFEKKCYPCHQTDVFKKIPKSGGPSIPPRFDAASFGLDDAVGSNRDFSSGNRAAQTRNALQNRYGNRNGA